MVFPKWMSATTGHSSLCSSLGSSVRRMWSNTSSHFPTTLNQMGKPYTSLTLSTVAPSNWNGKKWVTLQTHLRWPTTWHRAQLSHNNIVLLNFLRTQVPLTLHLRPTQPTNRAWTKEGTLNCRHGPVSCSFNGGDPTFVWHCPSQDWKEGSVTKRIGGWLIHGLYDVMMSNGLTCRFHANQLQLRST